MKCGGKGSLKGRQRGEEQRMHVHERRPFPVDIKVIEKEERERDVHRLEERQEARRENERE
jgi:hypothetical protein